MPSTPLTAVPARLVLGDSLRLRFEFPGYSVEEGWSLGFLLSGPTRTSLSITADGAGWLASLEADTDDLAPGRYTWTVRLEKELERATLLTGSILVTPNPDSVDPPSEQRSFARIALAAAEAAILTRGAHLSFSVFGRSYQFETYAALLAYRNELAAQVAAEDEEASLERGERSARTLWVRW